MAGYVYLLTSQKLLAKSIYKIGLTKKDVNTRISTLNGGACRTKDELYLVDTWFVQDCKECENKLHDRFSSQRVRNNREFFTLEPENIAEIPKLLRSSMVAPRVEDVRRFKPSQSPKCKSNAIKNWDECIGYDTRAVLPAAAAAEICFCFRTESSLTDGVDVRVVLRRELIPACEKRGILLASAGHHYGGAQGAEEATNTPSDEAYSVNAYYVAKRLDRLFDVGRVLKAYNVLCRSGIVKQRENCDRTNYRKKKYSLSSDKIKRKFEAAADPAEKVKGLTNGETIAAMLLAGYVAKFYDNSCNCIFFNVQFAQPSDSETDSDQPSDSAADSAQSSDSETDSAQSSDSETDSAQPSDSATNSATDLIDKISTLKI